MGSRSMLNAAARQARSSGDRPRGRERVKGIEPSCPAWEAGVLPLNYTRVLNFDFGSRMSDWQAANVIARKSRRLFRG